MADAQPIAGFRRDVLRAQVHAGQPQCRQIGSGVAANQRGFDFAPIGQANRNIFLAFNYMVGGQYNCLCFAAPEDAGGRMAGPCRNGHNGARGALDGVCQLVRKLTEREILLRDYCHCCSPDLCLALPLE